MLRPGNAFQSFVRASVESGMFPAAAKDPEGFMGAVLARRRNPGGPRELHLSSGIWLQVSDYKMKDGSHVGVYTDITEQKQRQAEIAKARAEAEAALERLKAAQLCRALRRIAGGACRDASIQAAARRQVRGSRTG
jgi:hypothetical protein